MPVPRSSMPPPDLSVRETARILKCSPEAARMVMIAAGIESVSPVHRGKRPRYPRTGVLSVAAKIAEACAG